MNDEVNTQTFLVAILKPFSRELNVRGSIRQPNWQSVFAHKSAGPICGLYRRRSTGPGENTQDAVS